MSQLTQSNWRLISALTIMLLIVTSEQRRRHRKQRHFKQSRHNRSFSSVYHRHTADIVDDVAWVDQVMLADQSYSNHHQNPQCAANCSCPMQPPRCKGGINALKDGCNCCYICARQHGDLCDKVYICDVNKGLFCDMSTRLYSKGICRAKNPRPCSFNDRMYDDGEQFMLSCSQQCRCQNSHVTCSSRCSHENRRPSSHHCPDAKLISIEGKCCKEWACPLQHIGSIDYLHPKQAGEGEEECDTKTSPWTPCSTTCGVGESMRVTNDNERCETVSERRLCLVRPCNLDDSGLHADACKSVWDDGAAGRHISVDGCRSVDKLYMRFCSTCKRKKCCGPGSTSTEAVDFYCQNNRTLVTRNVMMIRNCNCVPIRNCPYE